MAPRLPTLTAVISAVVGLGGCAASPPPPPPAAPLTHRLPLCTGGETRGCLEPGRVEGWLRAEDLRVIGDDPTHRGIQSAEILTLETRQGGERVVFRAKWRPQSAAKTDYSEPRVAIAAYHLQKRLYDEGDYVIPPTVGYCFPLAQYRRAIDPRGEPTDRRVDCAWGSLAYWLERADSIDRADGTAWYDHDGAYDRELYEDNGIYRRALGHINLLTYLTRNGDAHAHQFLLRLDPARPHVYLVDNSMGFGAELNDDLVGTGRDWTTVLVALPKAPLDRLFSWTRDDLRRLASVERYRATDGRWRRVPGLKEDSSLQWYADHHGLTYDGDVLHVGLTPAEIDALGRRIEALRERARAGDLPMMPR